MTHAVCTSIEPGTRSVLSFLLASIAVLSLGAPVAAEEFRIVAGQAENLVKFESEAPMESFDGKTSAVSGSLSLDPAAIADSIEIVVEVDVATFDTGVQLRNQHMCENHLHPEKFPKSTFRGGKVVKGAGTSLADGKPHDIVLAGALQLHGVTRDVQIPMKLQLRPGGVPSVRVETSFDVKLADYEIPRPQMLFMKLGETQKVVVAITAAKGAAPQAGPPATTTAEEPAASEAKTE